MRRTNARKKRAISESSDESQSGRATPALSAREDEDEDDEKPTQVSKRTSSRRASRQQTMVDPLETPRPARRRLRHTRSSTQILESTESLAPPDPGITEDATVAAQDSKLPLVATSSQDLQGLDDRIARRSLVAPTADLPSPFLTPASSQSPESGSRTSRRSISQQMEAVSSPVEKGIIPPVSQPPASTRRVSRRSMTPATPQQPRSNPPPSNNEPAEPTPTELTKDEVNLVETTKSSMEATQLYTGETTVRQSDCDISNPPAVMSENPMDTLLKTREVPPSATQEPSITKRRMVITHLVLTNFKSYAGRQVVGPFHVSFSSVVGPNGSGKSNVIDSLLFVFGFRASKMRQGKISALIHNSVNFPNLPFCEVEVHFQEVLDLPEGGLQMFPDSHLVVSRRAFKNNTSKYYMDGKETNFTTVTDFLRGRGIDLDHKRFLILQGEVESIAQMKPKAANEHDDGLLEYLEDIIGTSKYKAPIEEAVAEVETLNEVCAEKNSRVQHVEKEKSSLEDKKNKALAFIRDENELAEKHSALYQIYIDECNDNTRVTEEAILQMQELLNLELEKHQGSEEGIEQLHRQYKQTTKEYEAMDSETQAILKDLSKYDKESVKLEEKRKFLENKQKKLEKLMQSSRLAASECASLASKHANDIENKTAEIVSLEKEMAHEEKELTSIRESLKGKTQGLSDQIAAKQRKLEPWNDKINEKLSAIAVARSELDILREKSNAGGLALEDAKTKVVSIQELITGKSQELEHRCLEQAELEKEVAALTAELRRFFEKEPDYRSRLSSARQKAEEARSSLVSTQNQGNVLAGLMRLKESGRIEGFHGRLGNLGTIEEKYDVAISTACPALDNLVVDSVEVGQQCIEYLRKNNLGRANFILLDRLPRRDMSPIYTPDSVPRLFDLVKPVDPKFSPAFYSVLQNTLVAKDLEQANKIAYGARRWRVVTLDGQLIDLSGTMSGGGARVAKGAMSSKRVAEVSKDQVTKLDAERDHMEKRFQAFQEKQRQLEASLRSKKDQSPKLETSAQKLRLEIESAGRNLVDAKRRVKELAAELKPSEDDNSRAIALEKRIASLETETDRLRAEKAGVEEEIQALQDKIMEIGGVRLRGQKAKVDGFKEQILLLTEEVSNAEMAKSKNEKLQVKHERSRADSEGELEHLTEELARLTEQIKAQIKLVSEIREKSDCAQDVSFKAVKHLFSLTVPRLWLRRKGN